MAAPLPILRGTLDLLVLKAVAAAPMHGFEIASWIETRARGALGIEDSALYQALYRMEARGVIAAEWGMTEKHRRARYYRITSAGRGRLRTETNDWVRYAATVTGILTGSGEAA
jgi:PadR family transcriptional regulator